MKTKALLIALSVPLLYSSAKADLIAYEGFDYSSPSVPGTSIIGLNGGTGWDTAWAQHNTAKGLALSNANMAYTGLTTIGTALGSVDDSDGNPLTGAPGFGNSARRNFAGTNIDSGTIYLSGLFQQYYGLDQATVFRLHSNSGNGDGATLSVWFDGGNAGISTNWKTSLNGNADYSGDVALSGPATPAMFVLKYDFENEVASLFLNPDVSSAEPIAAAATFDYAAATVGGLGALTINNNSDRGTFDELRVASTWESAVGVPEPSSYALLAGCLALASIMLRRRG